MYTFVKSKEEEGYCKECGGFVEYCTKTRLLSSPPQYQGKCQECGMVKYTFCSNLVVTDE